METDRKYKPIKETRGWYFVEYHPVVNGSKFANLFLVITEDVTKNKIADAMEKELDNWLHRYPIPLFVSAFDKKDDLYDLTELNSSNFLIGFFDHNHQICSYWRSLKDEEIPSIALDREYVDNLYSNLEFTTYAQLKADRQKTNRQIKSGQVIFFIWLAVIPAIYAVFEYSSNLLAIVALFYSLYKATRKGLELIGRWPKSKKEKEKELEDRLKDHYYYHCQMNPEGFKRLKLENFEKMSMDEIAIEAESLKRKPLV
jgi:hypothetical protein